MDDGVSRIREEASRLRDIQARTLAPMPQADVVLAVCEWARRWRDVQSPWRRQAETLDEPFPFAHVRVSLDALLDSLTPEALWALIDAEGVRGAHGPPLVGHVIAGNTPLLAWTSVLRALLLRSASLVKLPLGPAAAWGRLFRDTLGQVSSELASTIYLMQWRGGTLELDTALCQSVDLVLAYGSDQTIEALRALTPSETPFLGYGHRVSFALVARDQATDTTVQGLARDVLLYDQGGCLSPHTVFVEGERQAAGRFAARLAAALGEAVPVLTQSARSATAAIRVREARLLARMTPETEVWEDAGLRWTVLARPETAFAISPTHGVVSVQPLPGRGALPDALAPVAGRLQGCAVAGGPDAGTAALLALLGVSYVCRPGELQCPPFSWREDGRDVLRSLLAGGGQHDQRGLGGQGYAADLQSG